MRRNEIRYYLHNLSGLEADIKLLDEQISCFKHLDIEYIKVPTYSHTKSSTNEISNVVEVVAIKRLEYLEKLQQELALKKLYYRTITNCLNYLDETQRQVIDLKYNHSPHEKANTYECIAIKMNKHIRYIQTVESDVISFIERSFKDAIKKGP